MAESHLELVERLFDAFNRRDAEGIVALCDEEMEFFAVETAEAVGRERPLRRPRRGCATTSPTSPASGKSC